MRTLLPEKMAESMIWKTVRTPPTMAMVLSGAKQTRRAKERSARRVGRREGREGKRRGEGGGYKRRQKVRERLPLLGVNDEHGRDLVVEEDSRDSGGPVRGGVALGVFGAHVVRGEVALVRGDGVL